MAFIAKFSRSLIILWFRGIIIEVFQFFPRDFIADYLLQFFNHIFIFRCSKRKGVTGTFGSSGPADPVNIIIRGGGNIKN